MILFIDDEIDRLEHDIDGLKRAGFEVLSASTVDEAMEILEDRHEDVEGVICDIMMPHGKLDARATREGLRTGVKLFEWARQQWPQMPFVIFTNLIGHKALWEQFRRQPRCLYLEKQEVFGRDFVNRVTELIPVARGVSDDDQLGSRN